MTPIAESQLELKTFLQKKNTIEIILIQIIHCLESLVLVT